MAVVRPAAAAPPNRTLMPIVLKAMLIAMPLKRNRETIGVKRKKFDEQRENRSDDDNSSEHTPAQKSKRQPFAQRDQENSVAVPESDAEELAEGTEDETLASRVSKSAIRRPRLDWEHVSTWNRAQVAPDDYEGEIARIWPNNCTMPSMQ